MYRIAGESPDHFGPAIYMDPAITNARQATKIDAVQIGENLQKDFSEVSQTEWDNVRICLTDQLEPAIGGLTVNMLTLNNSLAVRAMQGAGRVLSVVFDDPPDPAPKYRQLHDWAGDADILVLINLASQVRTPDTRFFPVEDPMDEGIILGHELHHAVELIYHNSVPEEQLRKRRKYMRRVAAHMGLFALGSAVALLGGADLLLAIDESQAAELAGGVAIAGGATTAATAIYMGARYNANAMKRLGIVKPAQPYGVGEDYANAYALATAERWRGLITKPN